MRFETNISNYFTDDKLCNDASGIAGVISIKKKRIVRWEQDSRFYKVEFHLLTSYDQAEINNENKLEWDADYANEGDYKYKQIQESITLIYKGELDEDKQNIEND